VPQPSCADTAAPSSHLRPRRAREEAISGSAQALVFRYLNASTRGTGPARRACRPRAGRVMLEMTNSPPWRPEPPRRAERACRAFAQLSGVAAVASEAEWRLSGLAHGRRAAPHRRSYDLAAPRLSRPGDTKPPAPDLLKLRRLCIDEGKMRVDRPGPEPSAAITAAPRRVTTVTTPCREVREAGGRRLVGWLVHQRNVRRPSRRTPWTAKRAGRLSSDVG
jgi:hypothetical protein